MKLIGLVLIVAGIILGVYVGVWLCLIGGIVDIIKVIAVAVNGGEIYPLALLWGIIKILGTGFFGWLSAMVLIVPGTGLLNS
jgi:hypothetical protein